MKHLLTFIFLVTSAGALPSLAQTTASRVIESGGSGESKAIMLTDASLTTHTIFAPQNISKFSTEQKLPLVVWGNGACNDSPWEHVNFLNEIASHGFFVIAIGTMPTTSGEQVTERSTSAKLTQAIDWTVAQNNDKDSAYHQAIDTDNIGVAGMSCGGLQALEVAGDSRISTLGVFNSGIFITPMPSPLPGMPNIDKTQLEKIHTPTLYLLGGPSDIAYENGMHDVENINHVPVFVGNLDVGHGGTYREPHGGEFARVATAWFQWQLKDDEQAGQLFVGNPPGLSKTPKWSYKQKNFSKPQTP
ncbi:alpha/beta hydrolase [Gilvimarinus sp. SDUM040013]|uniref:Alpha/beta hydrolase n=1 Tax=Gilvimarinus gilvus TaxID=3058038 RepID=A0ABU4RTN3_9GAMM|nr:alpha/beta hydrolase [Gilvimarinus sp. SDUM040013]MDO3386820.1 alpha/beta hydrolase [Gilvimarinus sp. SDUM040013]MDX6848250.1 alpha/beta hydrolase [Gilvimarinus sp. SDUM040013]